MLRHANEDLLKGVERLQKNRFDMVEELVYQRWLNARLRFEMQDHQTPSRKTFRNELEKNSGQDPYQKTKQLISYPNSEGFSSLTLSSENEDIDSSTTESSSYSQRSIIKGSCLIHGVKRFRRNKDNLSVDSSTNKSSIGSPLQSIALSCRFSCSMVTSDPSTSSKKNISTESPLMLSPAYVARLGRVSFNDAIVTVPSANIDKGALDEKEMCSDRSIYRSTMSAQRQVEMPEEKPELSSPEVLTNSFQASNSSISMDKYIVDAKVDDNETAQKEELHSGSSYVLSNEDKNDNRLECLKAAFYFFLFMLLVNFFSSSCRTY
ncbi:hypothetical protein SLE2022_299620 [Rubroshorea leprosula]